jgi:hypothetical protein
MFGGRTVLNYAYAAHLILYRCVLAPHSAPNPQVKYSHARVGGGRSVKSFLPAQVNLFLVGDCASLNVGDRLTYNCHWQLSLLPVHVANDSLKVIANIPLRSLATRLTRTQLMQIARVHGIPFKSKATIDALAAAVSDHKSSCPESVSIFNLLANEDQRRSERHRERNTVYKHTSKTSESKRSEASEALRRKWTKDKVDLVHKKRPNTTSLPSDFPPPPASRELRHSVIT